jgi:hypothetical protein
MMRWSAAIASILLANACSDSSRSAFQAPLIRDSAGVRIVENSGATWTSPWHVAVEPSVTIGTASGDLDLVLYQVTGALRLTDGRIVIANAGTFELRFYDSFGDYSGKAGRQGSGPGEFLSLDWISRLGPDSLIALDTWNQRLSYLDDRGNFGRTVRLEPNPEIPFPQALGFFADGSLLATRALHVLGARPPTRVERDTQRLFRYAPDGRAAAELGSLPGTERVIVETGRITPDGQPEAMRLARRFGRTTTYAAAATRFYVADSDTYEIDVYSVDGRLTHIFRKQQRPLVVTDADVRALEDSVLANETDPILRRAWARRPPAPATMPAYVPDIHVDPDLNLWVREYGRPGDPNRTYSVFAEDGVFLGTVILPRGLAILDVGRDYILGLRMDELDVEYVELYELRRGG